MAELEHVVKTFSLLETAEKEQPFLTREQKQDLYRIAFHKESMDCLLYTSPSPRD